MVTDLVYVALEKITRPRKLLPKIRMGCREKWVNSRKWTQRHIKPWLEKDFKPEEQGEVRFRPELFQQPNQKEWEFARAT